MATQPVILVGQVWADTNKYEVGRTLRVEEVAEGFAICVVLTNADRVQRELDRADYRMTNHFRDRRGVKTRIRVDRFRPTSTGYRLIKDVTDG